MPEEKFIMFQNRLQKVYRHLRRQAQRLGVFCYRIYDHDLPEFPFLVEKYEDRLYLAEYKRHHSMSDEQHEIWLQGCLEVICRVLDVTEENIFFRLRQRKQGRSGQYKKMKEQQHEFIVRENGLRFIVNLSDYLDTGLFLDHRITRQLVKEQSKDKKVLNLFCYTGSFSVYAAAGGASEVISVDLSRTYLAWAEKNMILNGFDAGNSQGGKSPYKFVRADVKNYLKSLPTNYFDLVVLDPPTFSNSKKMEEFLDVQKDHVELINDCLSSMKPGGVLYFSTNYRKFVLAGAKIQADSILDITNATIPFDFQGKLQRCCFKISRK